MATAATATTTGFVGGAAASEDTTTITVVRSGDEPVLRKRVPADWWAGERRVMEVERRLSSRFSDVPGIDGVGTVRVDEHISGRWTSEVVVNVDPSGTAVSIPDRVDGVPVRSRETPRVHPTLCFNDSNFDPVPGGVSLGTSSDRDSFTSGCKVSRGGTDYLITAAHPFYDSNGNKVENTGYQNGQLVGNVPDSDINQDWAILENDAGGVGGFTDLIEDNSGTTHGHVTEEGLRDLMGAGTTVYRQGCSSDTQSGTISEINQTRYTSETGIDVKKTDQVKLDMYVVGGDSGGPIFHQYTSNNCTYLAIIAVQSTGDVDSSVYETCGSSNYEVSYGGQAKDIYADHSISFDPDSYAPCY